MISSGNDCTVRVWTHLESHDGFNELDSISSDDVPDCLPAAVRLEYTQKYNEPPLDIAYQPPKHDDTCQPDSSVFAVACQDGKLYIYSSDGNPSSDSSLSLAPPKAKHFVGAINWGREETSSYLFASSEPSDRQDYTGFHRAYDIRSQKFVYSFSAGESGDAMAVEHFGQRLALFTRGSMESHILRLYDIQRKNGRNPIATISLNDFVTDGEVNCATFSPDGIYLAAARNDNIVDVYDSRNLEDGPLYKFKHQDPNHGTPGIESYGIVEAQWVTGFNGQGLGLISGGNDGCIRLWDVNQAVGNPTNGRVIAQTDFDIGHFSLGDIHKGEVPLVVGDSGGGISIFDRIGMRCLSD
jgi:WD40 repeat protein